MKKYLPDVLGAAGYGLLVAGLYAQFGPGVALMAGGVLLMIGAYMWGRL